MGKVEELSRADRRVSVAQASKSDTECGCHHVGGCDELQVKYRVCQM